MEVRHPLCGNVLLGRPPRPQKLTGPVYIADNQLKLVKALHLLACVCWVGGAFALMALAGLREARVENSDIAGAAVINMCIFYVDVCVVVPGVVGCIVTGLLYAVYTPFGFFKYFWIIYKWIICLNAFCWGMLFLGPWSDELFRLSVEYGFYDVLELIHECVMPQTSWGGFAQFLMLTSVVAISVYRPVSLFNWYDLQQQQPAGVRHGR